jgi:hypothetical protein
MRDEGGKKRVFFPPHRFSLLPLLTQREMTCESTTDCPKGTWKRLGRDLEGKRDKG